MRKLVVIVLYFALVFKGNASVNPKTIMLVLGSADAAVLEERVAIAVRLYRTQPIQKIIVSGGCGAHGSGICEATAMRDGLIRGGVNDQKIYKEENAKTTVQNYVFSRVLRDESDQKIIQPGDTVFVVSNHWHAIAVAARLQEYDRVVGRFYIEGSITPKATDKLDYVGIFNGQPDNDKFVLRGSWLTPETCWSVGDSLYYLQNNMVYGTDKDNRSFSSKRAEDVLPFLNLLDASHSRAFIDGGKFWWVRHGDRLWKVEKDSKKVSDKLVWSNWITGMPEAWKKGAFNTGVLWNNTLLLFANEKILVARLEKKGFVFVKETTAAEYFRNWPFAWGKSNVASAMGDPSTGNLILYRNMERMAIDQNLQVIAPPVANKLKWIEDPK
ncbi:YdcF family protein [Sphingobacterium faecale]|uniref:YdcF family protein n=1 Tax=Sphingobacterium faecale TaxID=2803775 RepID=A0ABS1R6H2_9SPHI|nr:YdcF family protein [Sphingobacterium faecale]MBL1410307.1 YdcF family protein [Sphingobacterium faecale]